jgi:hypothetical protein
METYGENIMKKFPTYRWLGIASSLLVLLSFTGCANFSGQSNPPPNPVLQPSASQPSSPPAATMPTGPRPQFFDFADIPIPSELELQPNDSYVFQSGVFKAGVLTLKGRVDLASLINFFQMAMPRENWKPRGGFRYRRSVLIFEKSDKTCVINLYEKMFYTYVEIYVAPVSSQI